MARSIGEGSSRPYEKREVYAAAEILAEEQQRQFFNEPYVKADFSHWSKAAYWTLDEAIALSFGKAPEHVNWERLKSLVHMPPFALQYQRRRDLALRALAWGELYDPVMPGIFLAWAKRIDLAVPPKLETAVTALGVQIADWKMLYDDLKTAFDEYHALCMDVIDKKNKLIEEQAAQINELGARLESQPQPAPEKSLRVRERESLLKLIIGMAMGGYGYVPTAARSEQPSAIANDLVKTGIALDVDTVRKWLREAAEILPQRQTEHD